MLIIAAPLYANKMENKIIQTQVSDKNLHSYFYINNTEKLVKEEITASVGNKEVILQELDQVKDCKPPISFLILMDASTSIKDADKKNIQIFLEHLLGYWGVEAEFSLMTFGEKVEVIKEFSSDRFELYKGFREIELNQQATNLYTGLVEGVEHYRSKPALEKEKKHILIISDGAEYDEQGLTKDETYMYLKEAGIPIYTLGLFRESDKKKSERYMEELGSFARLTGGKTLVFGQERTSLEELLKIMNTHIMDTYLGTFNVGSIEANGEKHYLKLNVSDPSNNISMGTSIQMDIVPKKIEPEEPEELEMLPMMQEEDQEVYEAGRKKTNIGGIVLTLIGLVIGITGVLMLRKRRKAGWNNVEDIDKYEEVLADTTDEGNNDNRQEDQQMIEDKKTVKIDVVKAKRQVELIEIARMDKSNTIRVSMEEQILIGRNEQKCDVALIDDESVSGVHCKIYMNAGNMCIVDMESTNGTYLNGIPVSEEVMLEQDDIVLIGSVEHRIKWEED